MHLFGINNLATIFFLRYGQSDGGIKVKNKEKNDLVLYFLMINDFILLIFKSWYENVFQIDEFT